jgi:disulfide bond formation protein DsbB
MFASAAAAVTARHAYFAVAAVCAVLISGALYLQHFQGLEPCPLCILQRFAFIGVGVLSLIAALLAPRPAARWVGVLALLAALAGGGTSANHVRIQLNPESLACGPGLSVMLENFPLTEVLPKIFRGSGDCGAIDWSLLGLSLPAWAGIWFALTAVALVFAFVRAGRLRA